MYKCALLRNGDCGHKTVSGVLAIHFLFKVLSLELNAERKELLLFKFTIFWKFSFYD